MDMNSLQQWMDFYKQNGLGPPQTQFTSPWGGVGLGMNPNQGALQFALRMAQQSGSPAMPGGQQPPNYFANLAAAQPGVVISENPMNARVSALQANPYMQGRANQAPQMGNNYLARILK